MHAHKFLLVFMLFIAISASSISALIGDVEEAEDFEFAEIEMVKNCYSEGFEGCELLIGPIFKIKVLVEDVGADLVFPPDTEAYDLNQYPRSWVRCQDPEAVVLARYDEVNKKWVPIEGSLAEYDDEDGGITVSAEVGEDGYYSVIPKLADFGFSFEEEEQSSFCEFLKCGEYTAYVSNPFSGRLHQGEELAMTFCGIYPGCQPIADGECSEACPPGFDPDCPSKICPPMNEEGEYEDDEDVGRCCGPYVGDCCDTTRGNGCDPDCWIKQDENGVVVDSTDLDCMLGGDVDMLEGASLTSNSFSFFPLLSKGEINSNVKSFHNSEKSEYSPSEEDMIPIEEYEEEGWEEVVYNFETPIVLAGPIRFKIESEDNQVWFKDFTITNLRNEELLQFPLKMGGEDTNRDTIGDNFDYWSNDLSTYYLPEENYSLLTYWHACKAANQRNPKGLWNYLVTHPTTWLLSEEDNGVGEGEIISIEGEEEIGQGEEDIGTIIFNLPPISVKRFHFKVMNNKPDKSAAKLTVTYSYYNIDSDKDQDGWGAEEDCHDGNPLVYPGADELCDGIDNNCNYKIIIDKSEPIPRANLLWSNRQQAYHYVTPCYGYLDLNKVDFPAYLEIWKRNRATFPTSYGSEVNYFGKAIDSYGVEYDSVDSIETYVVSPSGTTEEYQDSAYETNIIPIEARSIKTGKWRKIAPFNMFQVLASQLLRKGDDGTHSLKVQECPRYINYFDGPPRAGSDSISCVVGSHANSCGLNELFPDELSERADEDEYNNMQSVYDRYGNKLEALFQEDQVEILNRITKKIEFKPGEIIWGNALKFYKYSWSRVKTVKGELDITVVCYDNIEKKEIGGEQIDEGCSAQSMRYLYVCDGSQFDGEKRDCVNSNMLWSGSAVKGETIAKSHIIPEDAESGEHKFYVFACTEETEEENCWQFYEDTYFVCSAEENCDANFNIDADCDGIRAYKPINEQDSLLVSLTEPVDGDMTQPLDPDCVGKCPKGECDLITKKVCVDQEWVEPEDYCRLCSHKDSSCMEESKECTEEEKSCDNGCRVGVCDVAANMHCVSGGKWTDNNYKERCASKDSEFTDVSCTQGSCDTQFDNTCRIETRGSAAEWITYEDFCTNDLSCNSLDADCESCTPDTCDTYADKYCTSSGIWSNINYCNECGAVDAGCGIKACLEDTCDYNAGAICESGNWRVLNFNDEYCEKCVGTPYYSEKCYCEGIETQCDDNIDNDCDNKIDCDDPDCERKNVCLPTYCTEEQEGDTMYCGTSNAGRCKLGTRTCNDLRWSDCEGSIEPEIESCNNIDDDCDEATDEDCTGCTIGETRSCGQEAGSCSGGIQECKAFGSEGKWSGCFGPSYFTVSEEICNGLDDDCDSSIDEGCPCNQDETQECGIDIGECQKGIQTCVNGEWGVCEGEIASVTEVCDDTLDNDCDGLADMLDDACSNTEATTGLSASCSDQKQNQDEEAIDCGGDFCIPCDQTTCDDRKLNAYEEEMDCGGPDCAPCYEAETTIDEPEPSTTKKTAAKKEKKKSRFSLYLFLFIAVLLALFFITIIVKMKKTGKPFKETVTSMFKKKPKAPPKKQFSFRAKKVSPTKPTFKPAKQFKPKVTKSREEMALEESMKKSKAMLKKK